MRVAFLSALMAVAVMASHFELQPRSVIEEKPAHVHPGWVKTGPIGDDDTVTLTIALKQSNTDKLPEMVDRVSNPKSSEYGRHMSFKRLKEFVAPTHETKATVVDWLQSYLVSDLTLNPTEDFVIAKIPAQTAQKMLRTPLSVFQHSISGERVIRSEMSYSVPASLAPHIDFISGVYSFPQKFRRDALFDRQVEPTPLPSGNGPVIVRVLPGDGDLTVFFMPRCLSGNVTQNPSNLCSDDTDGSHPISSVNTILAFSTIQAQVGGNADADLSYHPQDLTCKQCQDFTQYSPSGLCNAMIATYSLPGSTVFCTTPVIGDNFLNYLPINVSMFAKFGHHDSEEYSTVTNYTKQVFLGQFVTPEVLKSRYNVPPSYTATNNASSQAVAEFLGQFYTPSDLVQFFELMGLPNAPVALTGPNNASNPGGEASLDIQYIMGVAPGVNTSFISLPGLHDGQEPFLTWITNVLNTPRAPWVHSVSYGDDENTLSLNFMSRVNIEFMKAGLRGLTLLFASGDNGVVASTPGVPCTNNFVPSFPPTSPYVTAVGATQFSTQTSPICDSSYYVLKVRCTQVGEIMSSTTTGSRITSGGGFSNVFAAPSYQGYFPRNYLNEYIGNSIPAGFFNQSGRAYPDLAAIGRNYLVVIGGDLVPVDGTSASTPVVAAIVSLLNDFRFNMGKAPLGFLNPLIYLVGQEQPGAFNDIVMGNNKCGESSCCPYGYPATPGWDATTGFGTPDFAMLMSYAASLQ